MGGQNGNGVRAEWLSQQWGAEREAGTSLSDREAKILNGFATFILTVCFTMLLYGLVTKPFLNWLARVLG